MEKDILRTEGRRVIAIHTVSEALNDNFELYIFLNFFVAVVERMLRTICLDDY